ncbi:2TM domain-containing protein [Chloroflexota bacterium]
MDNQISEEQIYEEAKKRVEEKKEFFNHLTAYIVVNIILVLIWAFVAGGGYPWFLWVLGGWGIGILLHLQVVFGFGRKPDRKAIEAD